MADPGGELLKGDIGEAAQHVPPIVVAIRGLELVHAPALERIRVNVADDHQVVPQHDRVPALFGGPSVHPVDPRTIARAEGVVSSLKVGSGAP